MYEMSWKIERKINSTDIPMKLGVEQLYEVYIINKER
jgi:hypothetical protein